MPFSPWMTRFLPSVFPSSLLFFQIFLRCGGIHPLGPHSLSRHPGAVIPYHDARMFTVCHILVEVFEPHLDSICIRVVGVLNQFDQRDSLVLDQLVAQHGQQASVGTDRQRFGFHRFLPMTTNSSPYTLRCVESRVNRP